MGKRSERDKRRDDRKERAIHFVRGGSICDPKQQPAGAHLIRGTNAPAVCRPTAGADTRPRWRVAGK